MMKLILIGEVQAVVTSEFEGKVSKKLQYLFQSDKGLKVISVKINETQSLENIQKGTKVQIEVKVSTMKDSFDVFYSQVGKLEVLK